MKEVKRAVSKVVERLSGAIAEIWRFRLKGGEEMPAKEQKKPLTKKELKKLKEPRLRCSCLRATRMSRVSTCLITCSMTRSLLRAACRPSSMGAHHAPTATAHARLRGRRRIVRTPRRAARVRSSI